ncbi:MAG: response regulator [Acidobacteriia bacterium]|nr:response regulator [Terriglobia bacterium]
MRQQTRQAVTHPSISIGMPSLSAFEPITILLVDDDDQLRELCRSFLADSGFRVLEADNGLEALLIAIERKGAIDLVITDLAMPQMSGAELGRVFREIFPSLNVLYMSGSPRETVGVELPADCPFLPKPFAPDALVNAAGRVLERRP